MPSKEEIRKEVRDKLNSLSNKQILTYSSRITQKLIPYVDHFQVRFLFLSGKKEVQTKDFIEFLRSKNKTVCVPFCEMTSQKMYPILYTPTDTTEIGPWGIPIVKKGVFFEGNIDVCVTPGVAFDTRKNRIGHGQGRYDRFFSTMPIMYKLGVCFPEQWYEKVPYEAHDITMDETIIP